MTNDKKLPPCSTTDTSACNLGVSSDADPDPDQYLNQRYWPRFLVVKSLDQKDITKHNPFVIAKAIEGIAGKSVIVKRMVKSKILQLEVDSKQFAINLLKTDMLHNIPVKISEHRTMNTSKGVISTDALDDLDQDEIKQRLNEFGQEVKEVYRIMVTKKNEKVPTKTLIITFLSPKIPDYLYIGFIRVKVRMYVPNPRRCYQCQRFGHTKNFCEHESVCDRCGQPDHESSAC